MSQINRYDHLKHGMYWDIEGDYVLYSDHEAVVARLRAEVERLAEAFRCRTIDWNEACNARDGWAGKAKDARAEADAYRKDAERYRWLTEENDWDVQPRVLIEDGVTLSVTAYSPQRLFDRFGEKDDIGGAIDAAMGEGK
jgi:hypothetical protein